MQQGVYVASLINNLGQVILTKLISHNRGSSIETIEIPKSLASGSYEIKITDRSTIFILKVIKN